MRTQLRHGKCREQLGSQGSYSDPPLLKVDLSRPQAVWWWSLASMAAVLLGFASLFIFLKTGTSSVAQTSLELNGSFSASTLPPNAGIRGLLLPHP